jgi:hypothetical protein
MKYSFFAICAFCFLAVFSCKKHCDPIPEDTPCSNLQSGLLAYYPFNGNANDESGNGNNGSAVNGAFFTTDFLGRPNKAAGFDGINDYIIVQDNGRLNVDSMTVSMMIMVNNINRRQTFVNRVSFSNGTAASWGIGQSLNTTNQFDFAVTNTSCSQPYTYDANNLVSSPETMLANRWYHVLVTFGSGVQKLYIDGHLRGSSTRTFTNLNKCAASQLLIGGWWQGDVISIDGKIDEVRIYNRVLKSCEIDELTGDFR